MRHRTLIALTALLVTACSPTEATPPPTSDPAPPPSASPTTDALPRLEFPPAPETPTGPLHPDTRAALDAVWEDMAAGRFDAAHVEALAATEDPRVAWLLSDLLRFALEPAMTAAVADAVSRLTGVEFQARPVWVPVTDHLIAWDLPAPPDYAEYKGELFTLVDARWEPFFTPDSDIDYRWISWGGVPIDDRPLGDPNPCARGCIPALDDPAVTDAAGGDWYPDDGIVFGVVVNGEARAYPRHQMETHELVNDTLGERRIGLPYCTLCGSAQLFFTDSVETAATDRSFEAPVLRTSGLLNRSNKVMYDLLTTSVFDTFTGRAVAGPMWEAGVTLEQGSVLTTTWGEWKAAHPRTTIVAEDGGIGRTYDPDPLGGRDDQGPIFPIGDRDLRLPVHEQVVGVITADGTPIAFPAAAARQALQSGEMVEMAGVTLVSDGGGLRARGADGEPLASHQAFWFAWSQFHPDTLLWEG